MSRPVRYLIPATLLSISLVFTGCKTIYSDTYSPKRNHFIPVKAKPKPAPIVPLDTAPAPAPAADLPPLGLPPVPPVAPTEPAPMPADGAAPMIPGL